MKPDQLLIPISEPYPLSNCHSGFTDM